MLLPLYSFVRGDTLGVLVLVQDSCRVRELGEVAQQVSSVRVAVTGVARVVFRNVTLDPDAILADVGLEPLDRIDVIPGAPDVL